MLSATVLVAELSLLALAIVMTKRVLKLYRNHSVAGPKVFTSKELYKHDPEELDDEIITSEAPTANERPPHHIKHPLAKQHERLGYEQQMQTLKQAQVFCANQLLDASRKQMLPNLWHTRAEHGLTPELPEWLNEAISLYLIGAVDFIGQQQQSPNKQRKRLIITTLKSQLHIDNDSAEALFQQALKRQTGSEHEEMVRVGASAAKSWLQSHNVPNSHKLSAQLQNWGVFV